MSVMRSLLLVGSQNQWLRERAPKYRFVRGAVARFMPGETVEDAIRAARELENQGIGTMFTQLGENVKDDAEAAGVEQHYHKVLDLVNREKLGTEVSIKPTQLGLDLSAAECRERIERLTEHAGDKILWVDMEYSHYVDPTLDIVAKIRAKHRNVGVCVQAYLYRTADDVSQLIRSGTHVRLVKGAYKEPPEVAFPKKKDVDENFFSLAKMLIGPDAKASGLRAHLATHDKALIARIEDHARQQSIGRRDYSFAMLFGIQRGEQVRLAKDGYDSKVLIAYGSFWFPWFMRRLAERPANVWFLAKNFFS